MKQVVFANPESRDGKELLADALEQMGYQAESGPWRSVYLQGALELRNGTPKAGGIATASPDTIKAMPPEMLFDFLGVRLNGPKAFGKKMTINLDFTDLKKQYALTVENGVLNYAPRLAQQADASLTMTKASLDSVQLRETTLEQAISSGKIKVQGNRQAFSDFMGLLDTYEFMFNIVTP